MTTSKEWERMVNGDPYDYWDFELQAARDRAWLACQDFNQSPDTSRRRQVELWRRIIGDDRPLPPPETDPEQDAALFKTTDPIVCPPISVAYGPNFHVEPGTLLNNNLTAQDICKITIGARSMIGPNVCLYGATHPIDPAVRDGLNGLEGGKEIHIGDDVWLGGSVIVLPGVTIGRGSTVGAGSVVTKDVPPFHVVAGNPARILRRISTTLADPPVAGVHRDEVNASVDIPKST